jgi:hypothetical protein
MNQPNSRFRTIRDFIGGLLLVYLIHSLFLVFMILIVARIIGSSSKALTDIWVLMIGGIGLSQFLYLIPVMLHFQSRGRSEVVKGIFVGSLLTILLSGACAVTITPTELVLFGIAPSQLRIMAALSVIVLIAIGFYSFKRRS